MQFNLLISTTLAARFLPQGSVSYLYYADRLNQLPLGLIGIGVGTAILPMLSRQIGGGDDAAAIATQNRAIELSLLLTLPATAALDGVGRRRSSARCSSMAPSPATTPPPPPPRSPPSRSACRPMC